MESRELAIRLARALDAKKAFNIHILEVEDLTTVTEYFVIATGNSTTHVGALADEVMGGLMSEADDAQKNNNRDGSNQVTDVMENDSATTTSDSGSTSEPAA